MTLKMRRVDNDKEETEKIADSEWSNASLFFDKGFPEWLSDDGKRGESIGTHLDKTCNIAVPKIYEQAYQRWLYITHEETRFAHWFGELESRLFIGLGEPHILEAQVTRHAVYGVPYIPGSAIKGLARSIATYYYEIDKEEADILFGKQEDEPDAQEAGYLIFHDAWWIPNDEKFKSPYVKEIVTVHAGEYYKTQGESFAYYKQTPTEKTVHMDMESPNPNHQLAVQGSFYFVVEGKQQWAELGRDILKLALQHEGIGGKVAAGYGYFKQQNDDKADKRAELLIKKEGTLTKARIIKFQQQLKRQQEEKLIASKTPFEQTIYLIEKGSTTINKGSSDENKNSLSRLINEILKEKLQVPKDRREYAADLIETSYKNMLKSNDFKKKLKKVILFRDVGKTI